MRDPSRLSCVALASRGVPLGLTFPSEMGTFPQTAIGKEQSGKPTTNEVALLPHWCIIHLWPCWTWPGGGVSVSHGPVHRSGPAYGARGPAHHSGPTPGAGSGGRGRASPPADRSSSTMAPVSWWRACNALMAAFFTLAALVQVSPRARRRAEGGRRWERGLWVPQGAGLRAPGRAGLQCRPMGIRCYASGTP